MNTKFIRCLLHHNKLPLQGCRVRDHVINTPQVNPGSDVDLRKPDIKVYEDLVAHRDAICVPYQRLTDARYTLFKAVP